MIPSSLVINIYVYYTFIIRWHRHCYEMGGQLRGEKFANQTIAGSKLLIIASQSLHKQAQNPGTVEKRIVNADGRTVGLTVVQY